MIIGMTVSANVEITRPRRLRSFRNSALTSRGRQLLLARVRGAVAMTVVELMLLPPVGT